MLKKVDEGLREITYGEAVREALREEMQRDERVFILGEDIGVYGNVFKILKGLVDEFPGRVLDTPISESAIVGAALGAAITGLRPVAEVMYVDFLNVAGDQMINHVPKIHFMSGGKLKAPLVVRTQCSLGRSAGGQHSQFFPAFFMNTPGWRVAVPATPYDVKGLLKTSIRSDDPVLFIEYALLYGTKGPVPEGEYTIPLGQADCKREGSDVTVVAVSGMLPKALTAAGELAKEGVDVEVIDPRTLVPLDNQAILDSVKKTGRLVIASLDNRTAGVTAEISAMVVDEGFDYLDAPIQRVAAPDLVAPFTPPLQELYVPSERDIVKAVKKIL